MILSHQDVVNIYGKLYSTALSLYQNNKYQQSLNYITTAAKWAYTTNFKYADKDLEMLLMNIADNSISKIEINSDNNLRFLFLETHGIDNRGLTQQYLRALMNMNAEILFVSVECLRTKCTDILKELSLYDKAKVILFDKTEDSFGKAKEILKEVEKFQPSKLFLHLMPWDVTSLMVTHSIKGSLKYNINLTDHAFWLGSSFIDYNFEFRAYGKTVSLEKRNLKEEQLLYLPYYPILPKDKMSFQGFPIKTEDKVVIFTGGAFYKMFGKNDLFFKIVDTLLNLSNKVNILIAGDGDRVIMNKKLSLLRNKERVQLIGNRKDINEVFKACDIYLDTYPLGGGLMQQFASLNSKPILSFSDFNTYGESQENMLKNSGNGICGHNNWDNFIIYATKLINDIEFRKLEGVRNQQLVPSVEVFNKCFAQLITKHENCLTWGAVSVNYGEMEKLYLEVENKYTHSAVKILIGRLKINVFKIYPKCSFLFLKQIIYVLYRRIIIKKNLPKRFIV